MSLLAGFMGGVALGINEQAERAVEAAQKEKDRAREMEFFTKKLEMEDSKIRDRALTARQYEMEDDERDYLRDEEKRIKDRTLEQQYADAVREGDAEAVERLSTAMRIQAQAKDVKDPSTKSTTPATFEALAAKALADGDIDLYNQTIKAAKDFEKGGGKIDIGDANSTLTQMGKDRDAFADRVAVELNFEDPVVGPKNQKLFSEMNILGDEDLRIFASGDVNAFANKYKASPDNPEVQSLARSAGLNDPTVRRAANLVMENREREKRMRELQRDRDNSIFAQSDDRDAVSPPGSNGFSPNPNGLVRPPVVALPPIGGSGSSKRPAVFQLNDIFGAQN